MKNLVIVPAADTLLYFPVYLAIASLAEELGLVPSGDATGPRTWEGARLTIRLELPPPGGDEGALLTLNAAAARSTFFPVAVCDPNILPSGNDRFSYIVLSVFIDRVALWCLYKTRKRSPNDQGLHDFLNSLEHDGILPMAGLPLNCPIAGFKNASTNLALAKHLLHIDAFNPDTEGFGYQEILALRKSNAVLTSSPWLKWQLGTTFARRVFESNWFPPIPFPFSGILTTLPAWRQDSADLKDILRDRRSAIPERWRDLESAPLSDLLRHLCCNIAFATAYPGAAINKLCFVADQFRNFGLPKTVGNELRRTIVKNAVVTLIKGDYLNFDVGSSLMLWEIASQFYEQYKSVKFVDWHRTYVRPRQDFLCGPEANEWFWSGELRRLISDLVMRAHQ